VTGVLIGAAGAGRDCAPAALIGRHRAAPSTSPVERTGALLAIPPPVEDAQ